TFLTLNLRDKDMGHVYIKVIACCRTLTPKKHKWQALQYLTSCRIIIDHILLQFWPDLQQIEQKQAQFRRFGADLVQILCKTHASYRWTCRMVLSFLFTAVDVDLFVTRYFFKIVVTPLAPARTIRTDKVFNDNGLTFIEIIPHKILWSDTRNAIDRFQFHKLLNLNTTLKHFF